MNFLMYGNMTAYLWLMFYYYIMIVPSQRALFLWVKKNIKSVIYIMMILDRLFFLGDALFQIFFFMDFSRFHNGKEYVYNKIVIALDSIVIIYTFFLLFVTMISCFATANYLNKHVKSLSASGGFLNNPRLHSQIRVAVTGIAQGVLCFLCAIWSLVYVMSYSFYFDYYIPITLIMLAMLGSNVNLGVGQTLFRERAVHVWKAVEKRLCTGKSSKDLRPPGKLVTKTSLSIIESSGVGTAMPL
ncbi:unnamed protein product [Arctogadus glacialis]